MGRPFEQDDLIIERDEHGRIAATRKPQSSFLDRFSLEPFVSPFDELREAESARREMEHAAARRSARAEAAEKRGAVARERAIVGELAAMRKAAERAEECEAAATERAVRAEARELAYRRRTARRDIAMAAMTFVSMLAALVAAVV